MAIQAIVYSTATGRVRRVLDPQANVPNVLSFLATAKAGPGESVMVYTKQAVNDIFAWQAAVNAHTGKSVQFGVDANDTYAVVDPTGLIVSIKYSADPLCGDSEPNCTLVQSTSMAVGGTWIGGIYTPPP